MIRSSLNLDKTNYFFAGLFSLLIFVSVCSGCIRLKADAGYWHQGTEDKSATYHGAGFDTQDLVPGDKQQGSITV